MRLTRLRKLKIDLFAFSLRYSGLRPNISPLIVFMELTMIPRHLLALTRLIRLPLRRSVNVSDVPKTIYLVFISLAIN